MVSLANRHPSMTARDRAGSSSTLCHAQGMWARVIARSKLQAHMHNPGGTAHLHTLAPAKGQSLRIQTGGDGELYTLDQFYLFVFGNSHERIRQQVRSNIKNWLKFSHRRAYTCDYISVRVGQLINAVIKSNNIFP